MFGSDSAAIMAILITDPAIIIRIGIDPTIAIMGRHTTGITGIEFITATIIITTTVTRPT